MKIWEKNYIASLLIFILVFYLSVYFLLASFFAKAMDQERERALNEYRFLSGLIAAEISTVENKESEASVSPGTIISKYGDYYSDFGIYLQLSNQNEVFYESPYIQQTKDTHPFANQTCQIINASGTRFVRVVDSLTGTEEKYTFVLQRDITDVYHTEIKHALYLILVATGCIIVLAVLLYMTMKAIYKPINNLAHELKTPLAAISGYAEYLQIAATNEEARYTATTYIINESRRLADITEKLLIIAGLKGGSIVFNKVSMRDIFENAKMTFNRVAYTVSQDAFFGDADLLQSLVNNLCANALKASPPEEKVYLSAQDNTLTVTDHGEGMTHKQEMMVMRGWRPSAGKNAASTGLGLHLCIQIADLHHAKIQFESQKGKGTTVKVIFTRS